MDFEEFKKQYDIHLNPQQEAAVQETEGPVLLLAVPGSGKTTVLVNRLGYMVYCKKIAPEKILTMTYTVSATKDMRRRFSSVFGEETGNRLEFRTINGVSQKIIGFYEKFTGGKAFELVSEEKKLNALAGQILKSVRGGFPTESDIKSVRTAVTYIKNMMLQEEEIGKLNAQCPEIAKIFRAYNDELRRQKLMDFDDQMVYAYMILRKNPDILTYFQRQYRYICVDEAQDTSKIQHQIVRFLTYETENLFMVGDEDQSIYGFRAAYPDALTNFGEDYSDAKILYLEQNYRSTGNIVKAASAFIGRNRNRHCKNMFTVREAGAAVEKKEFAHRNDQYEFLCALASRKPEDTAILYRDNESALPIINLFVQRGIPYRCRQINTAFFTHKTVDEVCDIIEFAYSPKNTELFMRIYGKIKCYIKKAEAEEAVRLAEERNVQVLNALLSLYKGQPWKVRTVNEAKENLYLIARSNNVGDALNVITERIGYTDSDDPEESVKIYTLKALAAQMNVRPNLFRANLSSLCRSIETNENSEEGLFLSTIHSSKGLEYDSVFLIDSADGSFPCVPPPGNKEEENAWEEERRLFYVAMTRAKNKLTIFTYKDAYSSFSAEIFCSASFRKTASSVCSSSDPFESGDFDAAAEYRTIETGQVLIHKRYGEGKILKREISPDRSDVILTVDFDGKIKELSMRVLKMSKMLTVR